MKTDEIASIMQVYMLQNIYSNNNSSSQTSMMFELLLQSMMKSMGTENTNAKIVGGESAKADLGTGNKPSVDIEGAIENASRKYGIDADFIRSLIKQESGFNPNALSKAGAMGLMQLMPSTAKSLGVHNPFDVLENINGGTRYLRGLMDTFSGSRELALAAYNGGIGRMKKLGVDTVKEIEKMPAETRNYVSRVMNNYRNYKEL